jgi:hypothetical protein
MIFHRFFPVLILLIIFAGRVATQGADISYKNEPVRKLGSYPQKFDLPLIERISDAPDFFINHIRRMDKKDNYENYTLNAEEKKIFAEYYLMLPDQYRKTMEKRLVAIYFIKNFSGGGMAEFLFDDKGKMFLIMAFNPQTLKSSLNEWITYRDNSSFRDDKSGITIENDLPKTYLGILHTLVHESTHAYDYIKHATPFVEPILKKKISTNDFTRDIWLNYFTPVEKFDFPLRKSVHSYGFGDPLDVSKALEIYRDLDKTPFSSLYGCSNWAEDFAESFTWNYLRQKLSIRYRVMILKDKKVFSTFSPTEKDDVRKRYKKIILTGG